MKRWQFWVGLALSAGFLYLALRGLGINDIWEPLKTAQYWWLIPGVVVYFIGVWVRAWRWHYLLRPVKSVSTKKMFPMVAIGYMGNNIYPARAGEVLRAVVLKRKEEIPISASLATIIIERIFDGVVMLGFVFLNLPELATLTGTSGFIGNIQTLALWGSGAFIGALAVFILAAMFPERAEKIIIKLIQVFLPEKIREKVLEIVLKFLKGLASLRSPKEALMVLLTSIVIWLLETGKYWFVMQAFNFRVSFFALMLMNGIVNLVTTIPSAPGYVGTFDASGIAVLSAYGVAQGVAAGYTLVLHAALWFPITLLGAYYMVKEGIRWQSGKVVEQGTESIDEG
ncbi:MAG: flippase-like domain-containing protein [Anaerolineales bacterium]|nr:flippase-like domain-containing protein [Anaerolineales bacterium]